MKAVGLSDIQAKVVDNLYLIGRLAEKIAELEKMVV